MTFSHSIARWLRTQDGPSTHQWLLGQASNTNIVLPATGRFWPQNPRCGYIRIKQATLGTNANVKIGSIVATDGTNIANIYPGDANFSTNGQYIDSSFLFVYDWLVSNFSVNVVSQNASSTFDVEVVGIS